MSLHQRFNHSQERIKRVWIDITHLAQYNFYKYIIINLSYNYNIILTIINRNSLVKIVKDELKEFRNINIIVLGKHKKTKFGIYWQTNILRNLSLLLFILKNKPNISLSNGYQAGLISYLLRIPCFLFGDDPEHHDRKLKSAFSTQSLYCIPSNILNIKTLQSPKEWSYLSPKYFTPNINSLQKYDLLPFKFIFIREVDIRTTNYMGQEKNAILRANLKIPLGFKVLFSIENKEERIKYPHDWILIDDNEKDIHSLIFYSRLLISSGDSMAREAAALGVESIYCGDRDMVANKFFLQEGLMVIVPPYELNDYISNVIVKEVSFAEREIIRNNLCKNWIDINEYIINLVNREIN